MCQRAFYRIVPGDLPKTANPYRDRLKIEAYLYEIVAELSDQDTMAFLDGLELLEASGEANSFVRSVIARMVRLIECDLILQKWQ